jgi:hypothetical protein
VNDLSYISWGEAMDQVRQVDMLELDRDLKPLTTKWREAHFGSVAADRPAAEEGVRQAYSAAHLFPPAEIIWCPSPIAIERSRKQMWYDRKVGESVKGTIVDAPIVRALQTVHKLPQNLYGHFTNAFSFGPETTPQMGSVDAAVLKGVGAVRWKLSAFVKALTRARARMTSYSDFSFSSWAQYDLRAVLGLCHAAHEILGINEVDELEGLWRVGLNAGWMVPHEHVCWLSERWQTCKADDNGRLHSASGPAIAFRDGWQRYFWKGVEVPSWMIEQPQAITAHRIDFERDPFVRRCMIEILTPEKYVTTGAPRVIATDHVGVLWRKQWSLSDVWAAVEVTNGTATPEGVFTRYFLQVPGHLRTPLEAVAWTYGISPDRYATLSRRT